MLLSYFILSLSKPRAELHPKVRPTCQLMKGCDNILQRHRGFHQPVLRQQARADIRDAERPVHAVRLHHPGLQRVQGGDHRGRLHGGVRPARPQRRLPRAGDRAHVPEDPGPGGQVRASNEGSHKGL